MATSQTVSPPVALEPLLTIAELQAILGASRATVYRLHAAGALPYVRVGGRRLTERQALRDFIVEGRRTVRAP